MRWYVDKDNFYALSRNSIMTLVQNDWKTIYQEENLTCLAFSTNKLTVGTKDGYLVVNPLTGKVLQPIRKELPVSSINDLLVVNNQTWFSTSDRAFREETGKYRYFQGTNHERAANIRRTPDDSSQYQPICPGLQRWQNLQVGLG